MLNQISTATGPAREESAQEMLMSCHKRIRHFSDLAYKLAHSHTASSEEVARAATDVHRYFTIALPLHEADENVSVHPRLVAALSTMPQAHDPAESQDALLLRTLGRPAADAMVEQHESIDQLVEGLMPLCVILMNAPQKAEELSEEMDQIARALREMFDVHLQLEESTVFPAMQRFLSEDELREILSEMKERRR